MRAITDKEIRVRRIPGGYSIEFRGLHVDSSFQVIEREDEKPARYTHVEYERDQGLYISEEEPNKGTIRANEDPHVLVHNKRGWGLTAEKVWSDADYMEKHDDIYIAVYVKKSAEGEPELLEGTVRRLKSPSTSLYYCFDELEEDTDFDDYEIFEVLLTNPVCDTDGNVTSYSAIEKISEGGTLTVGGKPKNKAHQEGFTYDVDYTKGEATGGGEDIENVRTDTIENTRQGIKLIKTDWNGQVLPGAVFTLKDEDGVSIGADSYTSDADGLITIAYLDPGTAYTLEETVALSGFQKPSGAWSVEVGNNVVSVSGDAGSYEIIQAQGNEMAVVILKDKGFSLQAVKVDADNENNTLAGAVFALYKQVEAAGGMVRDQRPIPGYEALTAESDGVIPGITSALKEGVYYLSEVTSPSGYKALGGDLVFTVSKDGIVEIPSHVDSDDPASVFILNNAAAQTVTNWIASEENEGHVTYTITIPNEVAGVPVKILKVDQSRNPLAGAEFSLSGNGISEDGLVSTLREIEVPGEEGQTVTEALIYENAALPVGEYTLTETGTPSGYNDLEGDVTISVGSTSTGIVVTAKIGETEIEYPKVAKNPSTGEWTVEITNQSGAVLPYTGGPGTEFIRLLGVFLTVLAEAGLVIVKRRRDAVR